MRTVLSFAVDAVEMLSYCIPRHHHLSEPYLFCQSSIRSIHTPPILTINFLLIDNIIICYIIMIVWVAALNVWESMKYLHRLLNSLPIEKGPNKGLAPYERFSNVPRYNIHYFINKLSICVHLFNCKQSIYWIKCWIEHW